MTSSVYFNSMQNTSGATYHNVIQVVYASVTVTGSSTYTFPASSFNSLPSSSGGVQILTTTFQPKFANSKILVETNNIPMCERDGNYTNQFRIFAHAGSTLLGWSYSGIWNGNFPSSYAYNLGGQYLHCLADSWGTDNRTIRLAVDADLGSSSPLFIHYSYTGSWVVPPITLTLTELGQ